MDSLVSFESKANFSIYSRLCLLGVCAYLDDIKAGCSSTTHIDGDRLYQGTLGKVLNLLRHGGTEEQSLPLALRKARNKTVDLNLRVPTPLGVPHQKAFISDVYNTMHNNNITVMKW